MFQDNLATPDYQIGFTTGFIYLGPYYIPRASPLKSFVRPYDVHVLARGSANDDMIEPHRMDWNCSAQAFTLRWLSLCAPCARLVHALYAPCSGLLRRLFAPLLFVCPALCCPLIGGRAKPGASESPRVPPIEQFRS